jgi:hypothetical protein
MTGRDKYPGLHKRWPTRTAEERFMAKVSPEPNTGCWLWLGTVDSQTGYAIFAHDGIRAKRASHFAFKLKHGRLPHKGLDCCHTCDVRICVSPDHVFEGTRAVNMQDAARKGRIVIGTAKVTVDQAREIQRRALAGERTRDLAREFHLSPPVISRIKHVGLPKFGRKVGTNWKEV